MAGLQWLLDMTLVLLLAATLFHAMRLERALGVLKRDRGALEALVAEFNDSTREAQSGIEKLRSTADGAARAITRQTEAASALREDLVFLIDRGDTLADRMDKLVRAGRSVAPEPLRAAAAPAARPDWRAVLHAEHAPAEPPPATASAGSGSGSASSGAASSGPSQPERVRSQAERDLLAALRMAR